MCENRRDHEPLGKIAVKHFVECNWALSLSMRLGFECEVSARMGARYSKIFFELYSAVEANISTSSSGGIASHEWVLKD